MSITTGLPNFWRYSTATLAAKVTASGSSPLQWKIGASTILATSDGYGGEREKRGAGGKRIGVLMMEGRRAPGRGKRGWGGKADLVVDEEVDRAAGAVTLQARQAEALRHHALAREGGVAV